MNPAPMGERAPFTGRAAYAITQIYYYAVSVVGVGFVIGGGIALLIGVRELILPERSGFAPDSTRDSVRAILFGLAFVIVGVLTALWHMREARRRETRFAPGAFWGKALYYHLVAFITAVILMGGAVGTLSALVDVALPPCQRTFSFEPGSAAVPAPGVVSCEPRSDGARAIANGLIVMIVAGGVWLWHIREARRPPKVETPTVGPPLPVAPPRPSEPAG